jgi:hypothetical protein
MATNSTTDGMGFDRVNQEVTSTETISGTNVYGVVGTFATLSNADAEIIPSVIGSATSLTRGGFIQAGSTIGSPGFIKFGTPYSSTGYYVNAIPMGSITGFENYYVSGVKHASGVGFKSDAATLRYDWIAIGN